jgi:BTB/POZ domain
MFTHDMEENRKSKVTIVDLDSDTVQDMIAYIYSGRVSS